jgi:hypothetical protein
MTTLTASLTHLARRLRVAAADADYAQRRLLELRTGLPLTPATQRRSEVAELEAMYSRAPDR